ncbi:MAG: EAL domain-containing protein [Gammaproteobacteria bacterium]|nr:EAL domain-containing protein [Gammaproteobacteria bacterium]
MAKAPVREIDIRHWLPLLGIAVLVVATSAWMWLDYSARVRDSQEASLAGWHGSMLRVKRMLEAGREQDQGRRDDEAGTLITLFDGTPGLLHLAVIDGAGKVRYANQAQLQGRPVAEVLPDFAPDQLAPKHLQRPAGSIALDADAHIRGYIPVSVGASADAVHPTPGGVLYLDFDTRYANERIATALYRQTTYFAVFSLLSLLGLTMFIRRFVGQPIAEITRGVSGYAPGAPTDIRVAGHGPLSELARAFNRLSEDLNATFQALHQREQRLDRILHSIGDAVIIVDTESRVERLNPVAEALTGWPRAEAIGRPLGEIFALTHYLSGAAMANPVLRAMATGEIQQLVNHAVLTHRDGHQYHIADSAAPIRGTDHAIEGGVLVFHDVSEAYRMREERRIAAIAFDTGAPQLIADGAGKIIRANQAALELSGYTLEELLGFHLVGDIFIGQDSPGLGDFLAGKSDLDTWTGRTWWRAKNGELMQIWVADTAIRNDAGAIDYYIISALDITQLVQTTAALAETRGNYRHLIGSIHHGVAIIADLIFADCNTQFALMLGRDRADIVGRPVSELSLPRQADGRDSDLLALEVLETVLREGNGHADWSMVRADGQRIDFDASVSRISWEGKPAMLATTRDITERRRSELERQALTAELARKEEIIRLASNAYGIASWELDWTTGEMHWAEGADAVLRTTVAYLPRTHAETLQLLHPRDRDPFDAAVRAALALERPFQFEFRVTLPDQGLRWFRSQGEVDRTRGGNRLHGATADITDYKLALLEIERLAYYDPLTGLANRRLLLDRLQQASAHASRNGDYGAVLFLDIDRFKLLNDSLGHGAGDLLLRQIAERCVGSVRQEDTVARLGGDEFVALVVALGNEATTVDSRARMVAEKLRARLSGEYLIAGHGHHITVSIGIAVFPRDGERAEDLLHHADVAMYQAKKRGRDTIAFYAADLQSNADTRLAIEQDLRLAVERNELELHYQPKVDASRQIVGAEALLRWHRPGHGLVPPMDFIPIAEESGLIYVIGRWVIRDACARLAAWHRVDRTQPLGIAVNISPLQFRHPDFVACVSQALVDFSIQPGLLTLEITESSLIENIDSVVARLNELKRVGVIVSVDDFGTGYSSLYYLKHLPLDEIKIDKSYVRDILDDSNDAAIVESIIAIAKNLQLRTVAEGVETEDQARILRALGCGLHQGYLYSRPLPAAEFERLYIGKSKML